MAFPLEIWRDVAARLGAAVSPTLTSHEHGACRDDELIEALRVAEHIGRLADAARISLAAEVGRRMDEGADALIAGFGTGSAVEVIERVAMVSGATARARLRQGQLITQTSTLTGDVLPAPCERARAALAEGRLSADALSTIVDALRPILTRCSAVEVHAAEAELVAAAVGDTDTLGSSIHELRVMASTWVLYLDPDGTLPAHERAERRRMLRLSRHARDGLHRVFGEVTVDVAAQLQRLLDAHLNPRVRAPRFDTEEHGREVPDECDENVHDPRTIDQKRHDAFASILSAAASSAETPMLGGAAPTLIVTVAESELRAGEGVALLEGADGPTPVPASFARHLGCRGVVHRLVRGMHGEVKEQRVVDRVFTHWQRKAIGVRDGGCIIPGCTVTASWCEVHHVVEHARGGPTDIDNGVLLCWGHHRGLETSGWEIRMRDGVPQVRPPTWIDPARRWRAPNRRLRSAPARERPA